MSEATDLPPLIAGRYRPIRVIGRGGMGAVYEVEHVHTGQRLALKMLLARLGKSAEAVRRFKREARASSLIQSDHVVRVTDADQAPEVEDAPFLVMELLEGSDLEHKTAGTKSRPEDVVLWLRQVARALAKAHRLGIVHRDLKPENLFLTQRDDGTPCVKVLDFGIAKINEQGAPSTQSGHILGTPTFMAPEQASGVSASITPRTDLFALGLIAFRLLVGRDYWNEGNVIKLIAQITIEPMEPPSKRGSTYGAMFDEWFAKACARDAAARFDSANEQVEALAVALGLPALPALSDSGRISAPTVEDLAAAATLDAAIDPIGETLQKPAKEETKAAPAIAVKASDAEIDGAVDIAKSLSASSSAIARMEPAPRGRSRLWIGGAVAAVIVLGGFYLSRSNSAPASNGVASSTSSTDRAPSSPTAAIVSATTPASGAAMTSASAPSPSASTSATAQASNARAATASAALRPASSSKPASSSRGGAAPSASAKRGPLDEQN